MSDPDPIGLFADIFARAASTAPPPPADHTAVALATATALGRPSIRIVLMRQFDSRGFVFFTNYESRKAGELEENPRAALCFYWHWIEEQIRVEGTIVAVSAEDSDRYFASRPRGSQLGAWASRQSRELEARARLEHEYREIERRYEGTTVPRPPFWGGYRLVPDRIEFWKAGNYRLHDRLLFAREGRDWQVTVLYP